MGKKNARKLFLVNSGIPSKELLKSSLKHPSHVVDFDYASDTFDSVTQKLLESPSEFSEFVWITHGSYKKQIKFFEQQETWSVVENISNRDPQLETWKELKKFVEFIKFNLKIDKVTLLICDLMKYDDYKYICDYFRNEYDIQIEGSNTKIGSEKEGGSWTLTSNNQNIREIYFNENINRYTYVFSNTLYDYIIIGGGPAGIMAAYNIANNDSNATVLILEKNEYTLQAY